MTEAEQRLANNIAAYDELALNIEDMIANTQVRGLAAAESDLVILEEAIANNLIEVEIESGGGGPPDPEPLQRVLRMEERVRSKVNEILKQYVDG